MVVIRVNGNIHAEQAKIVVEGIHRQALTGVIVLPSFCELLNEVPADEEIQVVQQKQDTPVADKYSWSFDEQAEIWWNCGQSIEDCIAQARDENDAGYKTVFIGERRPFVLAEHLRADILLETLEEAAYEFCGAGAEDWDAFNRRKSHELAELEAAIAPVVESWMQKYGYEPRFCAIENVAEYDLTPEEAGT